MRLGVGSAAWLTPSESPGQSGCIWQNPTLKLDTLFRQSGRGKANTPSDLAELAFSWRDLRSPKPWLGSRMITESPAILSN